MKKVITFFLLVTIFFVIKSNGQPICSQTPLNPVYKATIFFSYYTYMGDHFNNCAEGLGVLYYPDGSFYYGFFHQGLRHGSGVYVRINEGYSYGCFNNGFFVSAGACYNWSEIWGGSGSTIESRESKVSNIVSNVQNQLPPSAQKHDPSGYVITEIDPNTELGRSLLGGQ